MSNNVRDEQESTLCLQHRMVFSFSLTKEGSFCYITEEMISPNVSSQSDSKASLAQAGTYKLAAGLLLWQRHGNVSGRNKITLSLSW